MPTVCRTYKHDVDTGCLQYVRCKGSHFFFPTFFYLLLLELSINFPYILSCIYYYNSVLEQMMPTIFIQLDFVAWCDICIYVSQSIRQLDSWTVEQFRQIRSLPQSLLEKWINDCLALFGLDFALNSIWVQFWSFRCHFDF